MRDQLWVLFSDAKGRLYVVRKTYYVTNMLESKLKVTVLLESNDTQLLLTMRNLGNDI